MLCSSDDLPAYRLFIGLSTLPQLFVLQSVKHTKLRKMVISTEVKFELNTAKKANSENPRTAPH